MGTTKKKITLDGDKGIWTIEEVAAIIAEAGIDVEITKPDGDTHDTEVDDGSEPEVTDDGGEGIEA